MAPPPDFNPRDLPILGVTFVGHEGSGKSSVLESMLVLVGERDGAALYNNNPGPTVANALGVLPRARLYGAVTARRRYMMVDVPGGRRFIREASRMGSFCEVAVLVVSTPESVEAQTKELVLHLRGVQPSRLLVFLNKADLGSDPAWLDAVEAEVRESLDRCGLSGDEVSFFRGSAGQFLKGDPWWRAGVEGLFDALEAVPDVGRDHEGALVFQVAEDFGPVVGGRVLRGDVRRGQLVYLPWVGLFQVESLQLYRRAVDRAEAGEYVGVKLKPLERTKGYPRRGDILCEPNLETLTTEVSVTMRLLSLRDFRDGGRAGPVYSGWKCFVHLGTAGRQATIRLDESEPALVEGQTYGRVRVKFDSPVWVERDMPFAARDGSVGPRRTASDPLTWAGTAAVGRVTAIHK